MINLDVNKSEVQAHGTVATNNHFRVCLGKYDTI